MAMKVIVTGGAGFIGSHTVVELIDNGFEPVIVDNFGNSEIAVISKLERLTGKKLVFYEADCRDKRLMAQIISNEKPVGFIHFAAHKSVNESVNDPLKYYDNNINSTLVLLSLMQEYNIPNLIFSSSCTVYGEPDSVPVTEKTPRKKANAPYGNTKVICEDVIKDCVQSTSNLKAVSLRYFNPIGAHPSALIGELPRGVPNNLVPFITQTAVGKREQLVVFGDDYNTEDGSCIRDFIHVVDLAKAHVAALNYLLSIEPNTVYEVFNVGTGRGNSVMELIRVFEQVNNVKINYKVGSRREGDIECIYGNVDKAAKILAWKSQKSLEEALKDAFRWECSIVSSN